MASRSVICYPQPDKVKSLNVLRAFAQGFNGRMCRSYDLVDGHPAAFYGTVHIEHLWRKVLERKHEYFYLDNSFFDCVRGSHFRIGVNALQVSSIGEPHWNRWSALRQYIKPWRKTGRHILVIAQSEFFMSQVVGWQNGSVGWQYHVLQQLKAATDRLVIFRHWSRDKRERASTLEGDLQGAWALVTHSSAAANEALLRGIPVFTTGDCAASPMAGGSLSGIEKPALPDNREQWAAALAGKQWTLDEISTGRAVL